MFLPIKRQIIQKQSVEKKKAIEINSTKDIEESTMSNSTKERIRTKVDKKIRSKRLKAMVLF